MNIYNRGLVLHWKHNTTVCCKIECTTKENECAAGKNRGVVENSKSQILQSFQIAAFLPYKFC